MWACPLTIASKVEVNNDPDSYKIATTLIDACKWLRAMNQEKKSLDRNLT